MGSDGYLWITMNTRVQRMSPDTDNGCPLPAVNSWTVPFEVRGITSGPDGNIWFTMHHPTEGRIGKIDVETLQLTTYPISSAPNGFSPNGPWFIEPGPAGNELWFTSITTNKIGRITTSGSFLPAFAIPAASSYGITLGPPDKNNNRDMWITAASDTNYLRIIRMNGSGVPVEVGNWSEYMGAHWIVTGSDGNVWFTESATNKVARVDPLTNSVYEYSLPSGTGPCAITLGRDDNLWVTGGNNSKVYRFVPEAAASLQISVPSNIVAGVPFDVTVTARIQGDAVAVGYTGTVQFTSSDSASSSTRGLQIHIRRSGRAHVHGDAEINWKSQCGITGYQSYHAADGSDNHYLGLGTCAKRRLAKHLRTSTVMVGSLNRTATASGVLAKTE